MRSLILVAGAAIAVSGCSKDQPADNSMNVDSAAAAEQITSNDTTAIDAATGADANMAADVDYIIEENEDASENAGGTKTPTRSAQRETAREPVRAPAREDASDAGNAVENAE